MKYSVYLLIGVLTFLVHAEVLATNKLSAPHIALNDFKSLKVRIDIEGMSCFRCAEKIEKKLGRIEGISDVKVHLEEKHAIITFNDALISIKEIKEKITEIGYQAGNHKLID